MKRTGVRKKKSEKAKLKLYLDKLWSKLTKAIHSGGCSWCGKGGNPQSDHIQNRWKHSTRWRLENCIVLCVWCHLFRKKRDPAGWATMVIKNIGQDKWDALERESNRTEKVDLEEVKKYLEGIEAELKEKDRKSVV